ncbi:MAG: alkaline phosphatase family protein [Candidatus Eremiobacteraeota bacterium]|nr:alkaline phosphatase family protein [Candidatus Eremiobacteraeota bacterium]
MAAGLEEKSISNKIFKHCVLINIDGCRRDLLYEMIDSGELPVFGRLFGHGLRFTNATTVFPTITFAAQASGITGAYPANHGILSNMWMDRGKTDPPIYNYTDNFFHAADVYGYSLIGLPRIFFSNTNKPGLADRHLSKEIETIYQSAGRKNMRSVVAFHQFARGAEKRIRPKPLDMIRYFFGNIFPGQFSVFDESMTVRLINEMKKNDPPEILFIYFAPSDGAGHWWGADGQRWYLSHIVEDKLERITDLLKKKSVMETTLFVLFSDHGHSDVAQDQEHCISLKWISDIIRKSSKYTKISTRKSVGNDVVIGMEGGMAGLYLKDTPNGSWKDFPPPENLSPICRGFSGHLGNRLGAIVYRNSEDGKFALYPGENPMDIDLEETVRKINREYIHPGAPDIMIFSNYNKGYHFFKKPINAMHGNINPGDMAIPLIFAGNGIKKGQSNKPISIVDIAPTVASLMDFEMENVDGDVIERGGLE